MFWLAGRPRAPKPVGVAVPRPVMKPAVLALAALALFGGCSTLDTHVEPAVDLSQLKHVFVQSNLNDNHGLDAMIVRELLARGLQAERGPLTLMPDAATAYLTYQDQWDPDFNYLMSLGLTLRDARSDKPLASAVYLRPTAFLKTPAFMVRVTVDALFSQKPGKPAAAPPAAGRDNR